MAEKNDIKALILNEARKSFSHFGYKRTVIDDIVHEVGISKGAFYLHFKSKEELFREVMMEMREEIMTEWLDLFNQQKTVVDKMRVTLEFTFESLEKHPIFARVSQHDSEFRIALGMSREQAVQLEVANWKKFFGDIFRQGIESGELRADIDPEVIPIVIGSLKLLHFHKESIELTGVSHKQFVDTLIDMAMNGIVNTEQKKL